MIVNCNELISEPHPFFVFFSFIQLIIVYLMHIYIILYYFILANLSGHSVTPVPKWRTPRPLESYSLSSHTPQEHAHTRAPPKAQHCKHLELWMVNREPCVWSPQPGSCWDVSEVWTICSLWFIIVSAPLKRIASVLLFLASWLTALLVACLLLTWPIFLWECHILRDLLTNFESLKGAKMPRGLAVKCSLNTPNVPRTVLTTFQLS